MCVPRYAEIRIVAYAALQNSSEKSGLLIQHISRGRSYTGSNIWRFPVAYLNTVRATAFPVILTAVVLFKYSSEWQSFQLVTIFQIQWE